MSFQRTSLAVSSIRNKLSLSKRNLNMHKLRNSICVSRLKIENCFILLSD